MAPLSLRIITEGGSVTRTLLFDSRMTVRDAQAHIVEKLNTVGDHKDLGLFLTSADNDKSGIWLEQFRHLDYYMLRDGDSLHFQSRTRNLRLRLLDDSVKTLQVDEAKSVGDLMEHICSRLRIANHDEYGLCHEPLEQPEEKERPITGTLTLRRVKQEKTKDAKMTQLSKKLKTDDNVEWLDPHKTLRELGVDPATTLLFKRRLFFSDRNIDSRDPVQLNLLYVQTRDAILEGRHPVTEAQAADCKMRWVNIRDVSRRIVRKSLINPNQRSRPYKYCNELQFMRAFYREVSLPSNEYDSDGDQTNDMDDNDAPGFNAKMINDTDIAEDYLEAPADSDSEVEKPVKKERKRGRSKKSKNFEETKPETSYSEAAPIELEPSDPVDAFLLSIGATLKTFSPYHLNLAKSKIFAVVQEHDLQQIVQKQRHEAQGNDVKISTTDPMFLQ